MGLKKTSDQRKGRRRIYRGRRELDCLGQNKVDGEGTERLKYIGVKAKNTEGYQSGRQRKMLKEKKESLLG